MPESLLPGTLESLGDNSIALVPAGVSSSVLLRRPDIQEAEHNLKSANADIGGAGELLPVDFPDRQRRGRQRLAVVAVQPRDAGVVVRPPSACRCSPAAATCRSCAMRKRRKGLIATYEKSIQSAFKDVADALARRETLSEELDAQRQYVAAEQTSLDIAMKSYQAGVGDYLSVLTAQRTLWSAKTTLLSLQQTDLNNRITLWQSLGGGAS